MAGADASESPLLVLSDTFSSNPLTRFVAALQLLGFTLLLILPLAIAICLLIPLVAMLFVGRVWTLEDWWHSEWWLAFLILLVLWGLAFVGIVRRRRRFGARAEFFSDHVRLAPAQYARERPEEAVRVAYADIGGVQLLPPSTVRLRYRSSSFGIATLDVRLLRYTVEDEFDHLVTLIGEQDLDHVFSIEEEADRRWSRHHRLADIWPTPGDVTSASIGIATALQPDVMARVGDAACHFSMRDGQIRWHGEREWALQQDVNQVLARNGLVVCLLTSTLPGTYEIEFSTGQIVAVETERGVVNISGTRAGRLTTTDTAVGVQFERSVPNLIALVVVVAAMRSEYARRRL